MLRRGIAAALAVGLTRSVDTFHPSSAMMRGIHESDEVVQAAQAPQVPLEFKSEAVRLALTPGKTITEVARELDLTVTCLHDWVRQAGVDAKRDPQGALTTDERAELTRLRRELRTVEQERDLLKKTAAYFAKSQS